MLWTQPIQTALLSTGILAAAAIALAKMARTALVKRLNAPLIVLLVVLYGLALEHAFHLLPAIAPQGEKSPFLPALVRRMPRPRP